jgi:hypothetical protein
MIADRNAVEDPSEPSKSPSPLPEAEQEQREFTEAEKVANAVYEEAAKAFKEARERLKAADKARAEARRVQESKPQSDRRVDEKSVSSSPMASCQLMRKKRALTPLIRTFQSKQLDTPPT